DRQMTLDAAFVDPGKLEITERLVCFEGCTVSRPAGGVGMRRGQFPSPLADAESSRVDRPMRAPILRPYQAMLGIRFPVEIRRDLRQASEALFALAQYLLGVLSLQELA